MSQQEEEGLATRRRTRRRGGQSQVLQTVEDYVGSQVPATRREEIRRYLRLFGYKPETTILQVHVAGYFGRGRMVKPREAASRAKAAQRYGGRTFTVVGRTHDPGILRDLIPPRKKTPESSPGYSGYLFKGKNRRKRNPDDLLPLDFVPATLHYPQDWRNMFGTRGYLITMHVPSDFARGKNELARRLRTKKGEVDVKKPWNFLDEMEPYAYEATRTRETGQHEPQRQEEARESEGR